MRILFVNRPEARWVGGDFVKLRKVAEGLGKLGVEADVYEMEKLGLDQWFGVEQYDIVHTWNFSMPWSKYAVWLGGKKKKKLVASMIYHDTEAFVPYGLQQVMMDHMDACIYETESEVERVRRHLKPRNTFIVPNGVDSWWFEGEAKRAPIRDYVLTVGRIEPTKGQYEAAKACRKLGLRYVIIGGTTDPEYAAICAAEGALIYPPMPQERLRSWYAGCSAYVQPSSNETWGMAVDEAGTQGAPIVVSEGFERKDIPATYCRHGSVKSIAEAIGKAIEGGRNVGFQEQLRKRTWDSVAADYKEIYEKII